MPAIALTKSYLDGEILLEADLDNIKDGVETFLNTTQIDDDNIQNAGITASSKLVDESVTTAKIADSAITAAKLAVTMKAAMPAGSITMFHTFNGAVSVPRGWMICNADVVNSTTYEAIHGVGTYTTDSVSSSALDGLNLPDFVNKYAVGVSSTTQDGTSAITDVGNSSHQVNIQHSHTVDGHTHSLPSHSHKWYEYVNTTTDATDGAGNSLGLTASNTGDAIVASTNTGSTVISGDQDTDSWSGTSGSNNPGTNNQLSTTQSIQPDSQEVLYIIKVV